MEGGVNEAMEEDVREEHFSILRASVKERRGENSRIGRTTDVSTCLRKRIKAAKTKWDEEESRRQTREEGGRRRRREEKGTRQDRRRTVS